MRGCTVTERINMKRVQNHFEFTGAVFREDKAFVSICLELDVASQGTTACEARKMLAEAVGLYMETCFEDGLPYLRPVPEHEDPRIAKPPNLVEVFPLRVDCEVHAVA